MPNYALHNSVNNHLAHCFPSDVLHSDTMSFSCMTHSLRHVVMLTIPQSTATTNITHGSIFPLFQLYCGMPWFFEPLGSPYWAFMRDFFCFLSLGHIRDHLPHPSLGQVCELCGKHSHLCHWTTVCRQALPRR